MSDAIELRRATQRKAGLSKVERRFIRNGAPMPLLVEWQRNFPRRYDLYLKYSDSMEASQEIELTDIERHIVAINLTLHDEFLKELGEMAVKLPAMSKDQVRAFEIVRKMSDTALRTIRKSKVSLRRESSLDALKLEVNIRNHHTQINVQAMPDRADQLKEIMADAEVVDDAPE